MEGPETALERQESDCEFQIQIFKTHKLIEIQLMLIFYCITVLYHASNVFKEHTISYKKHRTFGRADEFESMNFWFGGRAQTGLTRVGFF